MAFFQKFFFPETDSHYVVQVELKFAILLPQLLECCNYMHVPLCMMGLKRLIKTELICSQPMSPRIIKMAELVTYSCANCSSTVNVL
jgi:hypothetical protein